jgi:hypothetical protein
VLDRHLVYYTAFKDKDMCVAVGTDEDQQNPFLARKLIEAALVFWYAKCCYVTKPKLSIPTYMKPCPYHSSHTTKDPVKIHQLLLRRLQLELPPSYAASDADPSRVPTGPAEIDRIIEETRRYFVRPPSAAGEGCSPVGGEEDPAALADLAYRCSAAPDLRAAPKAALS